MMGASCKYFHAGESVAVVAKPTLKRPREEISDDKSDSSDDSSDSDSDSDDSDRPSKKAKHEFFSWKGEIETALRAAGGKSPLKKLRKSVIGEFENRLAANGLSSSQNLKDTFAINLIKVQNVKLDGQTVSLNA